MIKPERIVNIIIIIALLIPISIIFKKCQDKDLAEYNNYHSKESYERYNAWANKNATVVIKSIIQRQVTSLHTEQGRTIIFLIETEELIQLVDIWGSIGDTLYVTNKWIQDKTPFLKSWA